MCPKPDSPPSFEKVMDDLQKIVRQLEGGELSLEDSLKAFEEGVRLTRACQEYLAQAQKRIEILSQNEDGTVSTRPF
ncbi:MAG: exodeoxyribonuclease VII small subunit [Bacteriovoracia bacterium]